jgi:hypothetical protein
LQDAAVAPRTPCLLSPTYEYDVVLNGFFQSSEMVGSLGTQDNDDGKVVHELLHCGCP